MFIFPGSRNHLPLRILLLVSPNERGFFFESFIDTFYNMKDKVKNDPRSKFSNLSNWKEEA